MRKPVDGFPNVFREFLNVIDKRSIKTVLAENTGDYCEARFVECLYDVSGTVKRGVRIEVIHFGADVIEPEFLDALFVEGMRYEVLMRSALRNSRKRENVHSVGHKTFGELTGRAIVRTSSKKSGISDAQALSILGL